MKLINIHSNGRTIYLFWRDNENKLHVKRKKDFFPYYYEISPNEEGKYKGYDNSPLKKIYVSKPNEVRKLRSSNAYEADIIFTKRFLIDKIDKIEPCPIKIAYIDIEVKAPEFPNPDNAQYPVSCISVGNSFKKEIKTFWIKNFDTEFDLIETFIKYMRKEKYDLFCSWHVDFDYNYLYNRYPDFAKKLSPINETRYGNDKVLYPAGISIIDYLSWFKAFTRNKYRVYSLDAVAQKDLQEKTWGNTDFDSLNDEIKKKNINDVKRMIKLENKYNIVSLFDEIRRFSKVEWEDLGTYNSRVIDMLVLQEAKNQKIVLPMKPRDKIKEEFEGAYRDTYETGRFFNVGKYDLSGAYMYAIIDLALDSANIKENSNNNTIPVNITDRKTHKILNTYNVEQNKNGILPLVAKKLIDEKNKLKKERALLDPNSEEYKILDKRYDALKVIVLSCWGVIGNQYFRLFDSRVAGMITSVVRSLIWYVDDKLKELGYKVLYVDTDGLIIDDKGETITDLLNDLITKWAKEKFNKKVSIRFDCEGHFEKLYIATKCRYKGYLKTDTGIKEETKGLEIKRKDSTKYIQKFQDKLIDKILNKESEEIVIKWINNKINNFKNNKLTDIAFPCKLSRKPNDYKNIPIFLRALNNTENFNKKVGELYYYIYVKPNKERKRKTIIKVKEKENIILNKDLSRKEGIVYARKTYENSNLKTSDISVLHKREKAKDVVAFDKDNYDHINKEDIDWKKMIDRNIMMKIDSIFKSMKWDIKKLNFAEEVSKETHRNTISKSKVQVLNSAPKSNNKKYPNDYPIEKGKTLSKEELKKLNLKCKPKIKNRDKIEEFLKINNNKQIKALKNNFNPEPYIEEYNLDFQWVSFINTISSTMFKNRPGRSIKLLVKDKNYDFIYGIISLSSPMINKKINKYFKDNNKMPKVDFNFINRHIIDINVCVGTGILTKYLTGKLLTYIALSEEIKNMWDKKYNTDIKYIMTTSIYGKSSIYNRIKSFKFLGLSEGWNVTFTQKQIDWLKKEHKKLYPHHKLSISGKSSHLFRRWNQVWRKYHDKMPFFPYKLRRGTYLFDINKTPFLSIKDNIKYWKKRWYYPRKERLKNEK